MFDPSHPLIHSVPYIRGVPEYAMQVREQFRQLRDRDFIVAVDLPHGLEPDVLRAVKRLPRVSLIVDVLKRGILVTPSCASIEVVRSFLDAGVDYHFVDASLPVRGPLDDWRAFLAACEQHGPSDAVERAEEYGIDLQALLYSGGRGEQNPHFPFMHLGDEIGGEAYARLVPVLRTRYMEARQQYMALRLRELLRQEMDILFVCGIRNWRPVMAYLDEPVEPLGDSFMVPVRTCRVKQEDLVRISNEIPYFSYLYELWREDEFSREAAVRELLLEDKPSPRVRIPEIYRYAAKLGLADGQLYPDLFNILSAAKYAGTDRYAYAVLKKACSYLFADPDSNCVIEPIYDYDFVPQSVRVLKIQVDGEDEEGGGGSPQKIRKGATDVFTFSRTDASMLDESDFMRYLESHYFAPAGSGEYAAEEFVSGMKDGIDVRESLRHGPMNKVFVKEQVSRNSATYVMDYGGEPDWRAYFGTRHAFVGAARHGPDREEWVTFTAFAQAPENVKDLLASIDLAQPLVSCIDLALRFSQTVFVFSANPGIPLYYHDRVHQVRVIDPERIPKATRERMRWFYIRK